ncbi:MAG TPA: HAMP domain-containing sensor histidine kinase [Bacteriovoracaceae bacterium]|nr:HAMP domain-containing sensor histidine kinase [Bacteriovoracaceae bacterium]
MKATSIFDYFSKEISPMRWITSITLSLFVSIFFAVQALNKKVEINQGILGALSPYLVTLVDINDRPEILRVIRSVGGSESADVILVKDGTVMASTRSTSELDMPFVAPETLLSLLGSEFSGSEILTVEALTKKNSTSMAKIYLISPLGPFLERALFLMVLTFSLCMAMSWIASWNLKRILKKSLTPLNQLHQEIQNLDFTQDAQTTPIHIHEMEEIRQAIMKTRHDLQESNEKFAEQKAKELNSQSYKQLIHDLHNPVAALRQFVRIQFSPDSDDQTKEEALTVIPQIAEEILRQVTSAKRNLEFDSTSFVKKDLRESLKESLTQVNAIRHYPSKNLTFKMPDKPVIVHHDSANLKRAIINLLENGLEASSESVRVTLQENDGRVSINILDDGPGIAANMVTTYFQGRGLSTKSNRQAYGLSSSNHIVTGHGGKIIYSRSHDGWSKMEIRLEGR